MGYNVIVIGGGIAGLSAAQRCAGHGLTVLLLEAMYTGGMAVKVKNIGDFPGFPEGISGEELTDRMEKGALSAGAKILHERVTALDLENKVKKITTDRGEYEADSVIIACGVRLREMGLENERALNGLGIFHSVNEGAKAVTGKSAAVWGSGSFACSMALELSEICSSVYIIAPEERLCASKKYLDEILKNNKIKVYENYLIASVSEGMFMLDGAVIVNRETMEVETINTEAVFVAPMIEPDSDVLLGTVRMTDDGAVIINGNMETQIPGVFAAGAVREGSSHTAVDAVCDGERAADAVNRYITEEKYNFSERIF